MTKQIVRVRAYFAANGDAKFAFTTPQYISYLYPYYLVNKEREIHPVCHRHFRSVRLVRISASLSKNRRLLNRRWSIRTIRSQGSRRFRALMISRDLYNILPDRSCACLRTCCYHTNHSAIHFLRYLSSRREKFYCTIWRRPSARDWMIDDSSNFDVLTRTT